LEQFFDFTPIKNKPTSPEPIVPEELVNGWYVRNGSTPVAWFPTYWEVQRYVHGYINPDFDKMANLEENARACGLTMSISDFVEQRINYYTQTNVPSPATFLRKAEE
jgi:hypothetical protein